MSREDPLKAEKDFSATLDEQIPHIEKIPDYKNAIDRYLVLEKQIRQSSDLALSKRVLAKIVDTLVVNNDWNFLNELITVLSKKHGQLKTSIQVMIQHVIENLGKLHNSEEKQLQQKIYIIETIRTITDKKIFVEVERAEVSRILSEIYLTEKKDLDTATEILCELQVETYSLMPFETKIDYILQQMQLTLIKKDYAQAKILSRKILLKTLKNFERADELKATYLRYLLQINKFENDYITIVKNSLLLVEIPEVKDCEGYKDLLTSIVYYIILSPFDNYQSDLIHNIKRNVLITKNVDPKILHLLDIFTNSELIQWEKIEMEYRHDFFTKSDVLANNEKNNKSLQNRIIEHNLRVINKFYLFIQLKRLAFLLNVSERDAETYVSEMVNKGMISAKINRPNGVIKFDKLEHGTAAGASQITSNSENINDLLNSWIHDVDSLLEEVDSIGHLINKEEMMHGIKQKA
ncbi:hypothetical protein METBIDRAFT_76095 [Metschnikowia bicuspidata var. bicuspidata NRRL YB-4993]|uniref:PCI domain-containing protein n=1 Tax=Metschnikowia bicuspidata var. bicuspidata NRRL YB-4993 TaxID=869754 RepID=A0A1A0HFL5_9ASCO|nr:hypothetical protein METBIDRAFT_76095 [Metschnikowia bicuspidata var. bicuspidata NRRL YB-4993]OBA22944.1 hypothetical protein METBIDRAFT_76095 [Metschnikowia bicuspidata var. bicuspidata NRRL YB-4993]